MHAVINAFNPNGQFVVSLHRTPAAAEAAANRLQAASRRANGSNSYLVLEVRFVAADVRKGDWV